MLMNGRRHSSSALSLSRITAGQRAQVGQQQDELASDKRLRQTRLTMQIILSACSRVQSVPASIRLDLTVESSRTRIDRNFMHSLTRPLVQALSRLVIIIHHPVHSPDATSSCSCSFVFVVSSQRAGAREFWDEEEEKVC